MQKVSDFQDLSAAEAALLAAVRAGQKCKLHDDPETMPDKTNPDHRIRAELLAVLITGGSLECGLSPFGVELYGAQIVGELRLTHLSAVGDTHLCNCRFEETPNLRYAQFKNLILNGSELPGLNAVYMQVAGGLSLARTKSTKPIDISAAKIGGQLSCDNAKLEGGSYYRRFIFVNQSDALKAEGIVVSMDVFLTHITATGRINFLRAIVSGSFYCKDIFFNCKDGAELFLQSIRIDTTLKFDWQRFPFRVSLVSAFAHELWDEIDNWHGDFILDGFTYNRFSNPTASTAKKRLPWLKNGSNRGDVFTPQPYTQAAKVLRAMGHDAQARRILVEREQILAREARLAGYRKGDGTYLFPLENPVQDAVFTGRWLLDLAQHYVVGYGFSPKLAAGWLFGLFLTAWIMAHSAWEEGSFAPNSDVILTSAGWQAALAGDCFPKDSAPDNCEKNPAETWANDPARGMDWDTFNAPAYALDLVVPILTLGQTDAWAPSKDRGAWGWALWWGRWVLIIGGWLVSALGVAAITGVMQRERE